MFSYFSRAHFNILILATAKSRRAQKIVLADFMKVIDPDAEKTNTETTEKKKVPDKKKKADKAEGQATRIGSIYILKVL